MKSKLFGHWGDAPAAARARSFPASPIPEVRTKTLTLGCTSHPAPRREERPRTGGLVPNKEIMPSLILIRIQIPMMAIIVLILTVSTRIRTQPKLKQRTQPKQYLRPDPAQGKETRFLISVLTVHSSYFSPPPPAHILGPGQRFGFAKQAVGSIPGKGPNSLGGGGCGNDSPGAFGLPVQKKTKPQPKPQGFFGAGMKGSAPFPYQSGKLPTIINEEFRGDKIWATK